MDYSGFVINAIISLFISIIVFWIKKAWDDCKHRKSLARAFLVELDTLLAQYQKSMNGKNFLEVDDSGIITDVYTMIVDNAFLVVYDHNSDKLGLFDEQVIRSVVELYTNVRGYIYSIKTWNEIILKEHDIFEMKRYNKVLEDRYQEIERQYNSTKKFLEKIIN